MAEVPFIKVKPTTKYKCGLCGDDFENTAKLRNHIINTKCKNQPDLQDFKKRGQEEHIRLDPVDAEGTVVYVHNRTRLFCGHFGSGGVNNGYKVSGIFDHLNFSCPQINPLKARKEYRNNIRKKREERKGKQSGKSSNNKKSRETNYSSVSSISSISSMSSYSITSSSSSNDAIACFIEMLQKAKRKGKGKGKRKRTEKGKGKGKGKRKKKRKGKKSTKQYSSSDKSVSSENNNEEDNV